MAFRPVQVGRRPVGKFGAGRVRAPFLGVIAERRARQVLWSGFDLIHVFNVWKRSEADGVMK